MPGLLRRLLGGRFSIPSVAQGEAAPVRGTDSPRVSINFATKSNPATGGRSRHHGGSRSKRRGRLDRETLATLDNSQEDTLVSIIELPRRSYFYLF
jgi:hypothetical protein